MASAIMLDVKKRGAFVDAMRAAHRVAWRDTFVSVKSSRNKSLRPYAAFFEADGFTILEWSHDDTVVTLVQTPLDVT